MFRNDFLADINSIKKKICRNHICKVTLVFEHHEQREMMLPIAVIGQDILAKGSVTYEAHT